MKSTTTSTTNPIDTSSQAFFEARYRAAEDPWQFADSAYEQFRYDRILATLSGRTYGAAFEPGCSIGVLTQRLAPICSRLLATDLSPTALERAAQRCAGFTHVDLRCEALAATEPAPWDLLLLSEIGYYLPGDEWRNLSGRLIDSLPTGATVLASHWLGHSEDHRIGGDEVHAILHERRDLHPIHAERHDDFRLDHWSKR